MRVVAGAGGLLVVSADARQFGMLTHVARRGGVWTARPVALAPGAQVTMLAGSGGPLAAVVYVVPAGARVPARSGPGVNAATGAALGPVTCWLAIVDLRSGRAVQTHPACGRDETVTGLAVVAKRAQPPVTGTAPPTPAGDGVVRPVDAPWTANAASTTGGRGEAAPAAPTPEATVYVGLWRSPERQRSLGADPAADHDAPGGRLLALDAGTGTVLASAPLAGAVHALLPGPHGRRAAATADSQVTSNPTAAATTPVTPDALLYGIEAVSLDPVGITGAAMLPGESDGDCWRLLRLRGDTLEVEHALPLPWALVSPALPADGRALYGLASRRSPTYNTVVEVDLASGAIHQLGVLTGNVLDLAATHERVYASSADDHQLWVLERTRDRRQGWMPASWIGRPIHRVPTGRTPTGLALGPVLP
jgi:hypothetical protein